jgi:hypothetical protein
MNHPSEDELLLLAYGEAPPANALESHVAACATCRETVARLERARAALDLALPGTSRQSAGPDWLAVGLAAAAVLAGVLLITRGGPQPRATAWPYHQEWSAHAGYFAGGRDVIDIDSQLTRLEQGWGTYGRP